MGSRVTIEADQGLSASATVSQFRYTWQVQNEIPRISSWACQRSGGFPCPYTLHGRATRGAGSCALSVELDCSPVCIWVDQWQISTAQLLLSSPAVILRSQHWFCFLEWVHGRERSGNVPQFQTLHADFALMWRSVDHESLGQAATHLLRFGVSFQGQIWVVAQAVYLVQPRCCQIRDSRVPTVWTTVVSPEPGRCFQAVGWRTLLEVKPQGSTRTGLTGQNSHSCRRPQAPGLPAGTD